MIELDLDSLTFHRVLGRGATGTVFLVSLSTSPQEPFALKVMDPSSSSLRRARWELSVLSRLPPHPFLPSLLSHLPHPFSLALPFCSGGDLNSLRHLQPDLLFSPTSILFYASELVSALQHLHLHGIVYRDLKPENVLIQSSGHVTLTDFDLCHYLPPKPPSTAASPENPPPKHLKKAKSARVSPVSRRIPVPSPQERCNSFVGTEEYVSPEVVRGEGHEFAVDWWALGVLLYEMSYGKTPFRGRNRKETFRNVVSKEPEFTGARRDDRLTDLLRRLLKKDPTRRLGYHGGAEEVKAHPFFNGVMWDFLADVGRPPWLPPPVDDAELEGGGGIDVWEYLIRRKEERRGSQAEMSPATASLSEF